MCVCVCVKVDEQLALLQHEKTDLLKRLEEDQDDLNDLMEKHKALIAQVQCQYTPYTLCVLSVVITD